MSLNLIQFLISIFQQHTGKERGGRGWGGQEEDKKGNPMDKIFHQNDAKQKRKHPVQERNPEITLWQLVSKQ